MQFPSHSFFNLSQWLWRLHLTSREAGLLGGNPANGQPLPSRRPHTHTPLLGIACPRVEWLELADPRLPPAGFPGLLLLLALADLLMSCPRPLLVSLVTGAPLAGITDVSPGAPPLRSSHRSNRAPRCPRLCTWLCRERYKVIHKSLWTYISISHALC